MNLHKWNKSTTRIALLVGTVALTTALNAQTIFSTNFDGFVAGTDHFSGVGQYSYGYDADGGSAAFKALQYGEWGRNGPNGDFIDVGSGDLEARPNIDGADNARLMGTFVNPTLFTEGTGTYSFSFDYTGADAGASYAYLYKATGFDTTGSNDLVLDVAEGGFAAGAFDPFSGTGTAVVTRLSAYEIPDETVGGSYSVNFDYTAGDAIGIAFGSYNTAISFDNVAIAVPEPSTFALMVLAFTGAALALRRRRG